MPALQCTVDVPLAEVTCTEPEAVQSRYAIAANRMIGGQDVYVKLVASGIQYDAGTEIFQMNVTVQNLLAAPLGTTNGVDVDGVRLFFFSGPTVSAGGSGDVTVYNPTGYAFFTDVNQPYFQYSQILQPYEISAPLTWQFSTPPTATRFTFVVYVSAPQADENLPLLDRVWLGGTDTEWTNAANWDGGVPISTSTVAIRPDSLFAGVMPALSADAEVAYLLVGGGSTLTLNGFTMTSSGTVDAPGAIAGGLVRMTGAGSKLRGTVPSLQLTGGVRLQGATRATGAVSVSDGSLTVSGSNPLTISLP